MNEIATVSFLYVSVIKKIAQIFFAPAIPKPFLRPCSILPRFIIINRNMQNVKL